MTASLLPTPQDYTAKDFDALRTRLRNLANSVFPDWTDFSTLNFGNLLLEMDAHVGDVINFYLDAHGAEAFLPTLVQRLSLIRQSRLIGYTVPGAAAATGTVRFTLGAVDAHDRTIDAGTIVRSRSGGTPIRFTIQPNTANPAYPVDDGWIIPAGSLYVDAIAKHALQVTETFALPGTRYTEFLLGQVPYLDGSASASAAEGDFTATDSFYGADSDDLVFVVLVDQNDRARIRFGDGRTGRIPTGTLTVDYETGGGSEGNVDAGIIQVIEGALSDVWGTITAYANNPAAFSGGADRTSVERGRYLAPRSLRSAQRSVSRSDFETNAEEVTGVARTLMATRNEDPAVAENAGRLAVVALGQQTTSGRTRPAAPSVALLAAVTTMVTVTRPQTLTFSVTVEAATFITVNVSTRVYLAYGADPTTVRDAINDSLEDLFAALLEDGTPNPDIDFGAHLLDAAGAVAAEMAWDKIFNAIHDTTGVRKVDEGPDGVLLNGLRQSVSIEPREFPILGTVTVYNASTGLVI